MFLFHDFDVKIIPIKAHCGKILKEIDRKRKKDTCMYNSKLAQNCYSRVQVSLN